MSSADDPPANAAGAPSAAPVAPAQTAGPRTTASDARRRRRRRRLVLLLVLAVVVLWCVIAALQLLSARRHAQAGLDRLRSSQQGLTAAELIRGTRLPELEAAQRDFSQASDASGSVFLKPFEVLPFVGRQVRSVDALAGSAEHVVSVGARAARESSKALEAQAVAGPDRVALLERLSGIAGRARRDLRSVDLGPGNALIGPLEDARTKFETELGRVRTALADVDDASTGIAQVARGPSRYLLLAANNAEMRAGSGMLLSAGVLSFSNGNFTLGPMTSTADLAVPAGAVTFGGDLAARWGWAHPNQEWRNLALSPDFPANARLAVEMWKAKTGEEVDGVLVLDPVALQALLAATGPVEVDGREITKDNVVNQLLLQQYLELGAGEGNPALDTPEQVARREQLSRVARAVIARLDTSGWDTGRLVDELRLAAEGRHVLAWSPEPEQERAWRGAGIGGLLHDDSLLVAVMNRAGNKLDQFLPVDATLTTKPVKDGTQVDLHIVLRNETPGGMNRFVQGPYPFSDFRAGEYRGILAVDLPKYAQRARIVDHQLAAAGPDGPAQVVATEVQVFPGRQLAYDVQFVMPKGQDTIRVEPSARVPPIVWHHGSERWTDQTAVDLAL